MTRKLIAITDDASLQPTVSGTVGFATVVRLVAEHLGREAVALLAEPQPVAGEGRQQWMTEAGVAAPASRVARAEPGQAALARAELVRVRGSAAEAYGRLKGSPNGESRQVGAVLVRCFELPDDEENLWVVEGRPVLVGWGHLRAGEPVPDVDEVARRFRDAASPRPPVAPLPSPAAPVPLPPAPPPPARPPSRSWLWLLLAALLGAAVLVALHRACILTLPFLPTSWQSCAEPPQPDPCREHGCETGQLQITMLWNSRDDLDLVVDCPGGTIQYDHPAACGDGRLDIDANSPGKEMERPVENIRWQAEPPAGTYRITAQFSRELQSGSGPLPYEIQVRLHGAVRSCRGTLPRPVGNAPTRRTPLVLTLPGALPDCDLSR